MKYLLLFTFFINYSFSQSLNFSYVYSDIGKSFRLGCDFNNKKISIEPGLKMIFWNGVNDQDYHWYKDRFNPKSFGEFFGIYNTTSFQILNKENFKFQMFHDISFSYCSYENIVEQEGIPYNYNGTIFKTTYTTTYYFNPIFVMENNIGISSAIKLSEKIRLNGKLGIGITFFNETNIQHTPAGLDYQFNWLFGSIGIGYNLKK
jgi:hypothetical protein